MWYHLELPQIHEICCQCLTLLWNYLKSCTRITTRSKWKNYEACKSYNRSHMRICKKHTYGWRGSSLWHKLLQKHRLPNFGMGFWIRSLDIGVKCDVISTWTINLGKCFPIIEMHWTQHGGKMCNDSHI